MNTQSNNMDNILYVVFIVVFHTYWCGFGKGIVEKIQHNR